MANLAYPGIGIRRSKYLFCFWKITHAHAKREARHDQLKKDCKKCPKGKHGSSEVGRGKGIRKNAIYGSLH